MSAGLREKGKEASLILDSVGNSNSNKDPVVLIPCVSSFEHDHTGQFLEISFSTPFVCLTKINYKISHLNQKNWK